MTEEDKKVIEKNFENTAKLVNQMAGLFKNIDAELKVHSQAIDRLHLRIDLLESASKNRFS